MYFPLVACALDVTAKTSPCLSRHLSPSSLSFRPPAAPCVPPLEPSPSGIGAAPRSLHRYLIGAHGTLAGTWETAPESCATWRQPASRLQWPQVEAAPSQTPTSRWENRGMRQGSWGGGGWGGGEQDLLAPCVRTTAEVAVSTWPVAAPGSAPVLPWANPARNCLLLHLVPAETKTPRRREEKHSQGGRRWGRSTFLSASLPVLTGWGWGGHIVS